MKNVDVVIPVYRPDGKLYRLLESLCKQKYKPGRIQIMLTLSGVAHEEDQLRMTVHKIQKECPGAEEIDLAVEAFPKEAFDHGGTRNAGIARCSAPYVLCMTQDAVPCDGRLIENLVGAMERQPGAATVYARQVTGKKADILVRYTQEFNYPDKGCVKSRFQYRVLGIKTLFCSDVCCLYRRRIFEQLCGFEEGLLFGEDMLYARKALDAGYTIVYEPTAKVEHWHEYTMWKQLRRNFDIAVNQKDHPEVFQGLSSESEGLRYVKRVLKQLADKRAYWAMVRFVFQSGAKYIGFFLGKHYTILPKRMVLALTTDMGYFRRRWNA